MSSQVVKRKLIEVALPLEAINKEAAREKSIRHGHPSTLHLWWARRPLAACRAVLFAQLVDDPSAEPERFPTQELQDAERQRLFRIIEDLVKWENSNNPVVLEAARAEIRRCLGDNPPAVLDPFCGGGSIPLEAQRLGLTAHASDLNPVAVLITKALIEIPPRWAGQPPVHPSSVVGRQRSISTWTRSQGLVEDVRHYGDQMRTEAEKRIGHLYPKATLPDGSSATVIAWVWARTVECPNPVCRATMPLARSFWLAKKKGKYAWVRPVVDPGAKLVRFEIGTGMDGPPVEGTVERTGATCLVCQSPVKLEHIRSEGRARRMGSQLMAIVAEGKRERTYLPPTLEHEKAADIRRPTEYPDTDLPEQALGFRVQAYGMTKHSDLFTNRQLTALCTLSDLVQETHATVVADALAGGASAGSSTAYADAVCTYLGFGVSRLSDLQNALARWENTRTQVRNLFGRQAISMIWDYAECGLFSNAAGDFGVSLSSICNALDGLPSAGVVLVTQEDATNREYEGLIVSSDPPYYDNIGYADLADFFYVWLRRTLRSYFPDLLGTVLTPKAQEMVANPYRFDGSKEMAEDHFESGFIRTFARVRNEHAPGIPLTIFYAFKQSEEDDENGGSQASTGWEKMLEGLLQSGLMVTGTWPMRTELNNRQRGRESNALASSIVLVCRPRPAMAGITDRPGFIRALKSDLSTALRDLQKGAISPVDLDQAAIGPGMAVFTRFAKVVESSGDSMTVRTALALINQVKDEVLSEQEGDFDSETRWAIRWFEMRGFDHGPFGDAEQLSKSRNTSLVGLEQHGIAKAKGGEAWLIPRSEMPTDWDPTTDAKVSVWESCQHLVKALDENGEQSTAELLAKLGHYGETAKELAYRLFDICVKTGRTQEAQVYNALVTSWLEITRLVASGPSNTAGQLF